MTTHSIYHLKRSGQNNEPNHSTATATDPIILWAHGWGQTHQAFLSLSESFAPELDHYLLDLPGFGQSPIPNEAWSTADYALSILDWIKTHTNQPIIWIGHSFGCRLGIQAAALAPDRIHHLVCIAGAGLHKKRSKLEHLKIQSKIKLYKSLRSLLPESPFKDKVIASFGSSDYKNAGPMRAIFIKTVKEDLSQTATQVQAPTTLIYGDQDQETPVEYGQRFKHYIPNANLYILSHQNHYSLLEDAKHQVIKILTKDIKRT